MFTTAGFATPGSTLEAYEAAFAKKYRNPPESIHSAVGHDLIKVAEAAIIAAGGSTDPKAIHDGIADLKNVQGATRPITYRGTKGMPVGQVSLIRVKDGGRELVGQPLPETGLIAEPRMQSTDDPRTAFVSQRPEGPLWCHRSGARR